MPSRLVSHGDPCHGNLPRYPRRLESWNDAMRMPPRKCPSRLNGGSFKLDNRSWPCHICLVAEAASNPFEYSKATDLGKAYT